MSWRKPDCWRPVLRASSSIWQCRSATAARKRRSACRMKLQILGPNRRRKRSWPSWRAVRLVDLFRDDLQFLEPDETIRSQARSGQGTANLRIANRRSTRMATYDVPIVAQKGILRTCAGRRWSSSQTDHASYATKQATLRQGVP